MDESWAGFSQEELRSLRSQRPDLYEFSEQQQHRPHSVNKSRKQSQRERLLQQQCQQLGLQGGAASVPPEQLLSVPKHKPLHPQQSGPPSHPSSAGHQRQSDNQDQQKDVTLANSGDGSDNAQSHHAKPNSKEDKKKVDFLISRQEKPRWEILQQEQRMIEEKNKRKKALLAKAIVERSKRTQAETVKLQRIQKELQALDDMVFADIGILRNRIDQASTDYCYAQKRYNKAESEYVAAKLNLQQKTEIKEHLKEHLCTIIQQNELRKAKKLEELMKQLEVQADEEDLELEIEVEQILQQQEAETERQVGQSQSHTGTAKDNRTCSVTAQDSEHANHIVASPLTSGQSVQSQNSGTKSLSNTHGPAQAVNVTLGNSSACSAV